MNKNTCYNWAKISMKAFELWLLRDGDKSALAHRIMKMSDDMFAAAIRGW